MNISLLITGLGMGGAEKQVCLLADQFAEFGHQVTLISLTGSATVKPSEQSIDLIELGMQKTPLGFIRAYLQLRRIVAKNKPDVLHSHMFHANIMARLLRLTTKIKRLVCTAHSNNEGGKLRMLIYRLSNFLADINTNVSNQSVVAFVAQKAVKQGQMQAVYNGIDTKKFSPKDTKKLPVDIDVSNKFIFIAVGRLTAAKDYPNLLQAAALLKQGNPDFVIWIVGDGELKTQLQCLAKDLQLDKQIYFLGMCDDISELMNIADAFVLSSAWEGFGLVVAEAMACEKPVVATDCGGVAEVIGNCGTSVPPKNSQALAQAMQAVMEMTDEQRATIGKNARQRVVEHFSIDTITQQWIDIYEEK